MLTLTRRPGQKIRIGDGIVIVVKDVKGKQVRLGIEAPSGLPIYREEIYQEIVKEMGEAATVKDENLISSILGPVTSDAKVATPESIGRKTNKPLMTDGARGNKGKEDGDED